MSKTSQITTLANLAGSIYALPKATVPDGFLECDGAAISRTTYADLFAFLGTDYGVGDGSTTFNIPDLRGEFLRGWANTSASDPDRATRTDRGDGTTGDVVGSKQTHEFDVHQHATPGATVGVGSVSTAFAYGNGGFISGTAATTAATPSGGNETRPRNVNVMYVLKY